MDDLGLEVTICMKYNPKKSGSKVLAKFPKAEPPYFAIIVNLQNDLNIANDIATMWGSFSGFRNILNCTNQAVIKGTAGILVKQCFCQEKGLEIPKCEI